MKPTQIASEPAHRSVPSNGTATKTSASQTANADHGPLPIVIGITGHRDLREEDLPELQRLVRGIFQQMQSRYPSTPLIVLSPLAEGADRLGARVALKCGARLVVPLPLPRHLYETDFTSEESRQEFRELLDRAYSWFEIPLLKGVTEEDIRSDGPMRDEQYGYMGAYIVRNSQFLIALWDGVPAKLLHGTSNIVTFNLQGVPERFAPPRNMLDPVDSDPVYHIITPRLSNPNPVGDPLTLRIIHSALGSNEKEGAESLRFVLEDTDTFNRDAIALQGQLANERERSIRDILPASELAGLTPALQATLDLYATADAMAGHFSNHTHGALKYLFLLVTAAAVTFDLYTHLFETQWYLLLGYLLLLVATYIVVLRSERRKFQSKYLDYRALAEGLRVQLFWELVGVRDSVADYYLHKQRSALDWIRYALRVWNLPIIGGRQWSSVEKSDPSRLKLVLEHWVETQSDYFGRAAYREERKMLRLEKWGGYLIIAGISLALIQVVLQGILSSEGHAHPSHPLLIAIALAPILAGLMLGYAEKRAYGDHAKQYERMSILFGNARQHLVRLLDQEDYVRAQQLIAELGQESLMENGDWVLLHRDRPIEVPKG